MSWTNRLRVAAFHQLPKHWQPIAAYHYYRARAVLDRELPLLCQHLRRGTRAIDVGANEGVYTHAFASTGAMVEAFEPQPPYLDVLREYARRHPNVRIHGVALGDRAGAGALHVPARDGEPVPSWATLEPVESPVGRYDVEVLPVDSFEFRDVRVMKIDVDGHELAVLRGARELLARCRPLLLLEIEQRHLREPIQKVFAEVESYGYEGSFLHPSGRMRLQDFQPTEHQHVAQADQPHTLYINNFIFSPAEHR